MSQKLTIKQENFCQLFIEIGNASDAYRQAYDVENMRDTTINRNAHALMENNKIATRLAELMEIHAERHNINVDKLTNMHMAAYFLAMQSNNPSAAATNIQGIARLHGLLIERGSITHTGTVTHEHEGLSRTLEILGQS